MKKTIAVALLLLCSAIYIDGRKMSSRGRSSSSRSSSSRSRSGSHPAPTSLTQPQSSVAKPSLFAWQEKVAQPAQKQSNKPSYSYPSSQTGLSGNNSPKQPPTYQESIQRSNAPIPVQQSFPRTQTQVQGTNQMSHSYPVSNGLSGNAKPGGLSGPGAGGYPQQQNNGVPSGVGHTYQHGGGLPGSNAAPPIYSPVDVNRPYSGGYQTNNFGNNHYHPQGPPPPYSSFPQSYGTHTYNPGYGQQMPGYFGNYASNSKSFGGMSRTGSALTGVGIAGAGVGTILTGLALWNLARSTGHHRHTVIYDNRGQPVAVAPGNDTEPVVDPILGDLVNCTLTISNENITEILSIPCAIATSFTPEADIKDSNTNYSSDNTKCTVTVVTKTNREFMTTIPCSILLQTAADNNVTEQPILINNTDINNLMTMDTALQNHHQPVPLEQSGVNTIEYNTKYNCTPEVGENRDPINPCLSLTNNLTVIPLSSTEVPKDIET